METTLIAKELSKFETEDHKIEKLLYTGQTHTVGGRDGHSRSSDGHLDITLSTPGTTGDGTNPEQLFAAGWSACFMGALEKAAMRLKVQLPGDLYLDTEVDLGLTGGAFQLGARINVGMPGIDAETANALVELAHQTCPYSRATRGNINVTFNLL